MQHLPRINQNQAKAKSHQDSQHPDRLPSPIIKRDQKGKSHNLRIRQVNHLESLEICKLLRVNRTLVQYSNVSLFYNQLWRNMIKSRYPYQIQK